MAYKVKYGESWDSLETKYPGIKAANPSIRTPKAGIVLQTGGMWSGYAPQTGGSTPYQYATQNTTQNTTKTTPGTQTTTNGRYVPPQYAKSNQTTSPTYVPTTGNGTYNYGSVNTNRGNPNTVTVTVPKNKFEQSLYERTEEAKAALAAAETPPTTKKDNSSPYYWINGKRHKKNIVLLDAKGRPIHNWNALAGKTKKASEPEFVAADVGSMDQGSTGQFSWKV
jgi:hypothetical protein